MGLGRIRPPAGDSEKPRCQVGVSRGSAQVSGAPGWAEAPGSGVLLMKTVAPGVSGVGRVAGCPGLQLPLPGVWGTSCRSLPGPHPSFPLESFLPREGCPGPLGVDKETMVLDEPRPHRPA